MRIRPLLLRDVLHEPLLHGQRRGARRELQPVGDAEDVRIDRDGRMVEGHTHDDIGRLAPDARQPLQGLEIVRHLAAEFRAEHLAGREDVLRLIAEESAVADLVLECGEPHRHDILRRLALGKEALCRDVDALIGALR